MSESEKQLPLTFDKAFGKLGREITRFANHTKRFVRLDQPACPFGLVWDVIKKVAEDDTAVDGPERVKELARMLAGQEGTPDAPITRVHRPETQPPPPVPLDAALVHAVTEQDVELARLVTGEQDPLAAYEYSFPNPYPPLAVVPGQDLSFTVHNLIDALLDATDVASTERDVAVLLDALTALAGVLGLTGPDALRNLLAAGYLAARAYGIGGFGPRRLTAAYHALRLLEPTGPLPSGPAAAADLLAWIDGVNVDTWAGDLPVRLMQVLDRLQQPGCREGLLQETPDRAVP